VKALAAAFMNALGGTEESSQGRISVTGGITGKPPFRCEQLLHAGRAWTDSSLTHPSPGLSVSPMIERTTEASGAAFDRHTTESPDGRTPNSCHSAERSGATGVAFIRSYNSMRTGTPMASSPAFRARASDQSCSRLPPARTIPAMHLEPVSIVGAPVDLDIRHQAEQRGLPIRATQV